MYNKIIRVATEVGAKTLDELADMHQSLVMAFIDEYEALVKGFVKGDHCTPEVYGRLTSVTFPKLHGVAHLVDSIVQLGHPWGFNTGEVFRKA